MKAFTQPATRTIPAGEFKAKCLKLMDEAVLTQKSVTITKRGKVVGTFVPATQAENATHPFVGAGKGMMSIHGDIVKALPNEWAVFEGDD